MKKSSPREQTKAETAEVASLEIKHLSLHGSYSPLEIATLAASCRGSDLDARFQDAFGLLAHAEELARLGPWGIESKDRIERGDSLAASPEKTRRDKEVQETQDHRITLAERFCAEAKRDKRSGKILRNPFLRQICNSVDEGIKTEAHSSRLYNTWLKYATAVRAEDLTEATMHRPGGPGSWPVDQSEVGGRPPATETEFAEFKSRFESGKTATLHDDHVAKWLAVELFFWLGSRPKPVAKKVSRKAPRSRKKDTKGQFVASQTKGAEKDEKSGRFKTAP